MSHVDDLILISDRSQNFLFDRGIEIKKDGDAVVVRYSPWTPSTTVKEGDSFERRFEKPLEDTLVREIAEFIRDCDRAALRSTMIRINHYGIGLSLVRAPMY